MFVEPTGKAKFHYFKFNEKLLLHLIDTSQQFDLIKKKYTNVEVKYSIKYDLSNECTTVDEKFDFFNSFDDFFTKVCDVKIEKFVFDQQSTKCSLDFFVDNYKNYTNLFRSCLFQLYPIYSCLKLKQSDALFQNESALMFTKNKSYNYNEIQLPQMYYTSEELYLVNSLNDFHDYNLLPFNTNEFWTLFIFSLYTNVTQDYAYKSFINKWHFEKKIPLPELTIMSISQQSLRLLIKFFYYFNHYFYNDDMQLSNIKPIKACFAKKFRKCKQNINIVNEIRIVEQKDCTINKKTKLFPCILSSKSNEYCLFYKTSHNVNIDFEFSNGTKSTFTLSKNLFKLCCTLNQTPKFIRVHSDELVYLGTTLVEKTSILIDTNSIPLNSEFFLDTKTFHILKLDSNDDEIYFDFIKCKKSKMAISNFPTLSKLYAINAVEYKCKSNYVFTVKSTVDAINSYFINFCNYNYSLPNDYVPNSYVCIELTDLSKISKKTQDPNHFSYNPIQLSKPFGNFIFVYK
jgi:hypothetical protein